ncbi:UDP-N-acetylmuramate--alanine ligase [Yoonia sediminilitoris]|uniref:Uncharacterized protein n=1 Tax=Yoonia sediminilitoris TaxID=1286148 RepID=A0A2T6KQI6_9RHOB|nr:UDP-N-acetylmuramate--alanine ligase [Yoonia sediminilitoris]PUB18829.1 hypothetical protein C8N45_101418 [Yoonia sediminilitoris]RCW98997.1 hypothetical protein DFP92_101418 [Yoonia sediminilitoris]
MQGLALLGVMIGCALIPFIWVTQLVRGGKSGLALSISCVIGGGLAVLLYAAGRPFGIDPVFAMTLALLIFLPAMLGAGAGGFLGYLMRKRDDRKES